jgi:hypothetical protein
MAGYAEVNPASSVQPNVNPLPELPEDCKLTFAVFISIVTIEGIHLLSLLPITLLARGLITPELVV